MKLLTPGATKLKEVSSDEFASLLESFLINVKAEIRPAFLLGFNVVSKLYGKIITITIIHENKDY